jgi:hypothetical protein
MVDYFRWGGIVSGSTAERRQSHFDKYLTIQAADSEQ